MHWFILTNTNTDDDDDDDGEWTVLERCRSRVRRRSTSASSIRLHEGNLVMVDGVGIPVSVMPRDTGSLTYTREYL